MEALIILKFATLGVNLSKLLVLWLIYKDCKKPKKDAGN